MGKKQTKNLKTNKKSQAKKPSTQNTVGGFSFPDEIIAEILPRLDVKPLLRFRSVSQHWRHSIDTPSFVDTHLTRSQTRPNGGRILLSFSNFEGSKHYFYSTSLNGGEAVRHISLPGCNKGVNNPCCCYVYESINGVVCFSNGSRVHVLNPSTRNNLVLPPSDSIQRYSKLNSAIYTTYSNYSFGFDSSKNEYKVLHIIGMRDKLDVMLQKVMCEVFTIRPNESELVFPRWRKITHVPPYPFIFRGQSVCVSGFIYWIGMRCPGDEIIVAFDLAKEKFNLIPIPDSVPSKPSLTSTRGHLGLIGYKDNRTCSIELWILQDNDNDKLVWNKVSIEGRENQNKRPKSIVPVGNFYSGEMLLMSGTFSQHYDLAPCNNDRKESTSVRTIRVRGLPAWTELFEAKNINFRITNHVESFVPLGRMVMKIGDMMVPLYF